MKSKNLKKVVMIALSALVIAGGATQIGFASQSNKIIPNTIVNSQENIESNVVGKIIAFEDNSVHILSGDIPEIFQVSNDNLKDFYLGETVSVQKIDENNYELSAYKNSDFSMRYTTMGDVISNTSGILTEVNEDSFVINQGDVDMKIESSYKIDAAVGTYVSVDYMSFPSNPENKLLLDVYNEGTCLNLTIKEITRMENGQMVLLAIDDTGREFNVNVLDNTILFFNHSDLKVNDEITVYHDDVVDNSTTIVNGKMIQKI